MGQAPVDWRASARQAIEDAEREGLHPVAVFRQRLRDDPDLALTVALDVGAPAAIKGQRARLILERATVGIQALALRLSEKGTTSQHRDD